MKSVSFLRFFTLWISVLSFSFSLHARVWYVKSTASGANDGSSWQNAFVHLQPAIDATLPGDTICVAGGSYFPTIKHSGDQDRHVTFLINKDIILLGGFLGDDGTEGQYDDREPDVHHTILSGDIGVLQDSSDNAFHVLYVDHVTTSMSMDGFIVEKALGMNGFGGFDHTGGGAFLNADAGICSPVFIHCVFRDNLVEESGAGVAAYASLGGVANPLFIGCTFLRNNASGGGAALMYTDSDGGCHPSFVSCVFKANTARTAQGSVVSFIAHSSTSTPSFINCVVTGNSSPQGGTINGFCTGTGKVNPQITNCTIAGNQGGSVRLSDLATQSSSVTVRNSILWTNPFDHGILTNGLTEDVSHCIMSGFVFGEGSISDDPLFVEAPSPNNVPHALGDVHIQNASPAIDAGRNEDVPSFISFDLDGKLRFINPSNGEAGNVDIGAYEVQEFPSSTKSDANSFTYQLFPNPAKDKIDITLPFDASGSGVLIFDARGMLMPVAHRTIGANQMRLDISGLSSGVYTAVVLHGSQTGHQMFLVP